MWENWYDNIPTRESIIILELACTPDYMPWFKIHSKPYLLSEEQRRRPINNGHTITGPDTLSDDVHTTTPTDYARCVS
ncbi:hypothetical protein Goari_011832 [Gossypium aridum]|uniref:Uncharacterized protein n=1 Tax=Gossypium aridum TaxID=34290 RepID=A0A7J8WYL8_GOSAI|nr:hypothetical protein [Gossypium aridum]